MNCWHKFALEARVQCTFLLLELHLGMNRLWSAWRQAEKLQYIKKKKKERKKLPEFRHVVGGGEGRGKKIIKTITQLFEEINFF